METWGGFPGVRFVIWTLSAYSVRIVLQHFVETSADILKLMEIFRSTTNYYLTELIHSLQLINYDQIVFLYIIAYMDD